MWRNVLVATVFVVIVGGTLAGSKLSDADILTKVGRKATDQIAGVMPERAKVFGPLAKVPLTDFVGLEDKIRGRLRTDAMLENANIGLTLDGTKVKITGKVDSAVHRDRAIDLVKTTVGVTAVESELATPEGK
jgi:hypothetical protein